MLSSRSRLWSAIALLVGLLLVLTGLSAPAHAVTARSLSISISPTAVNAGGSVSISGRLTKSPSGSTVKIQRKVGTSWVTATSTKTTSSYGGYKVSLTMPSTPGKYQFRSIAGASGSLLAATSATVTATSLRKVLVKLVTNKSTIGVGETIELSGKAYPFVSGTIATIQRFNGIRWSTLVTTTISKTGTFKRFFKPEATTTYRVVVPRTGLLATGISPSVKVLIPLGPVDPVINTTTLPGGFTDTVYSRTLSKTGKAGTWAVTTGALPPGLSLGSNTGAITGTPTAGGTFPFTVTFSETETLLSDSQQLSIAVLVKPRITTTSLPDATGFVTYGPVALQKTGQAGAWSITSGTLPAGITFDTATGVLSGKPTIKVAGDYPLTFKYTETAAPQLSVSKQLPLHLDAAPNPVITTTSLPNATAFSDYSTTLAKTGKAGAWSITAGTLPAGVDFDTATGELDGRPTVSGDFVLTFRFTETESTTFGSKQLMLHVNQAPDPVITTTSLPDATGFVTYSPFALQKTGNAGEWSIDTGSLPPGMSFNTTTGVISGKPTIKTAGDYPLTFRFTEDESQTFVTKNLTLHLNAAPNPVITTTSLPDATGFITYAPVTLQKTGNAGTWSMTGSLPAGMDFDTATGVLSGRPTIKNAGDYPLTFKFTETESTTFATKNLTLHLNAASNPVITTTALPDATGFITYSPFALQKTGNAGTWSIDTGSLPPGMSLNTATGVISGKPTVKDAGDYGVTFRFEELESTTFATKFLTLHLNAAANPVISTTSVPSGLINTAYSTTLAVSTPRPGTWEVGTGSLPTGITLQPDGALSGTPTVSGTFSFSARFTEDESLTTDTQALQVTIYSVPVITTTALPDALRGSTDNAFSFFLASSGGSSSKTWSLDSGTLPPGLTLSSTGKISGTATVNGDYPFTVRVTDEITGATSTKALTIHVGSVAIFTATTPAGSVGDAYSLQFQGKPSNFGFVGWSVSGSLPPGLSMSSTGLLSGTPTLAGDYTFTVNYTVLLKPTRSRSYTLHVAP